MLSDSIILKHISHQPKRSAGFKQLVRELGLHGDERRQLNEHLQKLVSSGQLLQSDSDRYSIPGAAPSKNIIIGRLSMHRDGYGFVLPDPKSPDDRGEGRILRPVYRAHSTVVGTFHYGSRRNYVVPIDEKIRQKIIIPAGLEFPEKSTTNDTKDTKGGRRHRVLGEEAARRPVHEDLENVVVDVEITDWPSPTQNPRGKVVEILGYQDDFGVDVEIMIRKFHLPHRFPAEVLNEAQAIENIIPARELHRRRDYRPFPIVTI